MFEEENLLFKEVYGMNAFAVDYSDKKDKLLRYAQQFPSVNAFESQIRKKQSVPVERNILVEALLKQYEGIEISSEVREAVSSLKDEHTFTVTTGHQLNIFLGPLYVVYKICSTIALSRQLSTQFSSYRIVPVFWMASEDHDFEEISAITLFGKKIKWENNNYTGAVGRISSKELEEVKTELFNVLGEGSNADQLKEYINEAYDGKKNLAQATRSLVNNLFGKFGLVIVDGDDLSLKHLWKNMAIHELEENIVEKSTSQINAELNKDYYQQAAVRNINLFHLEENQRLRMVGEDEYKTSSNAQILKSITDKDVQKYKSNPEMISPNVLMRPLYQESILPNLAYIGGSGEYAYWMQLAPVFEAFQLPYPVVIIRNSLLEVENRLVGKMEKLNLKASDFCLPKEQLLKKFIADSPEKMELNNESHKLQSLFEDLKTKANQLDKTLVPYVEGESKKMAKMLESIGSKFDKVTKRKESQQLEMIERIKEKLTPGEVLKERVENFIPQYLKHGASWFDELIAKMDVIEKEFIILKETTT